MNEIYPGPPPHVVREWMKECVCCPICWHCPCDGVMAGGMCDHMPCECDDDHQEEDE